MKSLLAIYVTAAILFFAALSHAQMKADVGSSSVGKLSGHIAVINVDWKTILYIISGNKARDIRDGNEDWCFKQYKILIQNRARVQSQFEAGQYDDETEMALLDITQNSEATVDLACVKDLGVSRTKEIKGQLSLP